MGAGDRSLDVFGKAAIASLDAFARIITAWPAAFGGLDALAVNHTRRRADFPVFLQAVGSDQCDVDLWPYSYIRNMDFGVEDDICYL